MLPIVGAIRVDDLYTVAVVLLSNHKVLLCGSFVRGRGATELGPIYEQEAVLFRAPQVPGE